eukprot:5893409-Alexandrium_andersonii.AAC.1
MRDGENAKCPPAFVANYISNYECAQSRYQEAIRAMRSFEEVRRVDPPRAYGARRNGVALPAH